MPNSKSAQRSRARQSYEVFRSITAEMSVFLHTAAFQSD